MKKQISRALGIAGLILTLLAGCWLGAYAPTRNVAPAEGRGEAARPIVSLWDDVLRLAWPSHRTPAPDDGSSTETARRPTR